MSLREALSLGTDAVLEWSVVGSFTRLGPAVRRRLFDWEPLSGSRMDGRVSVVTGATSGLGRVTATGLARAGSRVVLVARDPERGERARAEIAATTSNQDVSMVVADMGDLDSVRRAAGRLSALPSVDVLIHNAGALSRVRRESHQGIEQTVSAQLIGPFLLTHLLGSQLLRRPSRVIWVTSGGMYRERLSVDALEMSGGHYSGVTAYARVKRAQVSLVEAWAPRLRPRGVTMVAMHPGWADTPGLQRALPAFRRLMRPLLRTPEEGAESLLWMASSAAAEFGQAPLWLDRRPRSPHRLARTRRSDTPGERERLWQYCCARAALTPQERARLS